MKKWTERAKSRMKDLGLTQEDLKDAFGVTTRGAVGHYLTGRRDPSPEQIVAVAGKLQTSVGWLLAEEPILSSNDYMDDPLRLVRALASASQDQVDEILRILGLSVPATPKGRVRQTIVKEGQPVKKPKPPERGVSTG